MGVVQGNHSGTTGPISKPAMADAEEDAAYPVLWEGKECTLVIGGTDIHVRCTQSIQAPPCFPQTPEACFDLLMDVPFAQVLTGWACGRPRRCYT